MTVIKLMSSTFYNELETKQKLVDFIMSAKFFSMSDQCQKFESAFAKKQQRKHAVFVSNGSIANLILIQSLLNLGKLKKNQKVGVSALTWATNIMPLIQLGLQPTTLDCELDTLNVSPRVLEQRITELDALFLTNVLGFSDDINAIKTMCAKHRVLLIEDNCESLGSVVDGQLLGNFGLASTFSFFVGHHISTIEGGMVVTDDLELYNMLVMVRAHGWDRNLDANTQKKMRHKHKVDDFYARYTFYDLAINGRPTEINGFIGNSQIGFWDEIVQKRANNFKRFQDASMSNPNLYPISTKHMDICSNFAVPVITKTADYFDKLRRKFTDAGVEIRPVIAGDMNEQPFFQKYYPKSAKCANSHYIHQHGFYCPNRHDLSEDEIQLLSALVKG